jgi:serine protease
LAVAGVRHVGTKVGYSSMGPEVSISAPAGNCVNSIGACLFSILTTTNLGTTLPGTNSYSDQTNYNVGTSFSAPQVAGVAALMLSVNPALQPAEIITRIKQTARAFPSDPTLPACPATVLSGDSQGQCNCTTSTCGAGLLDAGGAVTASLPPIPLIQTLDPLTVGEIRLDSSASAAASGRTLVAWQWSLDSAPAGASLADTNSVVATLHATTAGSYRVTLTVTDNLGSHASTSSILSVADIPAAGGGGGGGGGSIDLLMLAGLLGLTLLARRGG